MAADAGAQEILDLLNKPSSRLYKDAMAFSEASSKVFKQEYGVMPQYGVEALADMRVFYREVRQQIVEIETADQTAKSDALKALDGIDRQLGAYEASLELGISAPAMPKLRKSKQVGKGAVAGLRRTIRGLSK
jgi:CHAD domain-containing protein